MPESKVAVSWGDVLLIVTVAALGGGVCALSATLVDYVMARQAPTELAMQDTLHIGQLEQQLATARDDRAFVLAQRRDVAMRRVRNDAAQRMNQAALPLLPLAADSGARATPPPRTPARDSATALARAQQADSIIAISLDAAMLKADSAVVRLTDSLTVAKRAVALRLRLAQMRYAAKRAGFTMLAALLGIGVITLVIRGAMYGGGEAWQLRRKLVLTPALLLIALVLVSQMGGVLLTIGVASAAVAVYLAWALVRAAR